MLERAVGPLAAALNGLKPVLRYAILAAIAFSLPAPASAQTGGPRGERLIPATFTQKKDALGFMWNLQHNGVLGRTTRMMIGNGMVLNVNGNQFYSNQIMSTPDGKEYVLHSSNNFGGVTVTRRILLHEKEGVLRYLDIFENRGTMPLSVSVGLNTNCNNRYKDVSTDQGNVGGGSFGKKETGILIRPSDKNHDSILFCAVSPRAKVRPVINTQNKYSVTFSYQLAVPANGMVCLLHSVAQRKTPAKLDAKSLGKLFKPLQLSRLLKGIRAEFRSKIANYRSGGSLGDLSLLSSMSLNALGVERTKSDVLALGDETRLQGTASCGRLTIVSDQGQAEVPFENIAALVGGNRGRSEVARVFLRDGQVFTGKIQADDLRFVLPTGTKMDLRIEDLDRLVRSESPQEGKWEPDVVALIETFQGDRFAVTGAGDVRLNSVTPWGAMDFVLDDILFMAPPEEEPVGHFVHFKDGSRFLTFLSGENLTLKSKLFGVLQISPYQIRTIVTSGAMQRSANGGLEEEEKLDQPHLILAGRQRVVGRMEAPVVRVVTNAEVIEIPPDQIRLLRSLNEDFEDSAPLGRDASYQVVLWGGGVIVGHIKESILPFQVRGRVWRVPFEDVLEASTPVPRISDTLRTRIAGLINDLGNPDWQKRENATEELAELGYMAKPLLSEALKVNPDPEVGRRIQMLLDELD